MDHRHNVAQNFVNLWEFAHDKFLGITTVLYKVQTLPQTYSLIYQPIDNKVSYLQPRMIRNHNGFVLNHGFMKLDIIDTFKNLGSVIRVLDSGLTTSCWRIKTNDLQIKSQVGIMHNCNHRKILPRQLTQLFIK